MKRNKLFRHSDFRGLLLLTTMMSIGGGILASHPVVEASELIQPLSPYVNELNTAARLTTAPPLEVVFAQVETKTVDYSKKTQGCIKNRPDIAASIKNHYDDPFAYDLICRESSYNPSAINPTSGACGLAQALPCSKMKCELSDVDCQLDWIGDYVKNRYGTFENAINWHNENNWY